ncbi:UrvD/REP family ATP-dependent DNA helicase [Actinomyces naeslundii]|uniref:DNA 3'-5' helicase n=2 Tax=Actinomyces naeslundii TaxID=1655 RepID=A0AA47FHM0_ACTNA|nr:UrvD/REP family ATP-dependent DNA helicase [Actinomyces naeslundii]OMG18892.1 DNA helicase UvrD [Actinomyces naeslundii]PKY95329.1 ATP-dependent helicase [Actinomyces naeslundii]WAL43467.1 PD-(D/E)XK nuclease family protein [Actinomyces naeslundii]
MSQDPVRLLPPPEAPELPAADADGQRVLDRVADGSNVVVLGAPGTGKTSLALRLLAEAVAGGRDAVLLAPTRTRADWLRGRAAHLLREGHGDGVVRVRTPAALALTVLTTSLTRRPDPLPPPVLLAGAEEDSVLASMVSAISWPGLPVEATGSRAFRSELRNLLARAGELGVTADELADLGRRLNVPIWGPAAQLLRTWDAQGRTSAESRAQTRKMDTARLQDRAVEALGSWDSDAVTVPRPVPDLIIVDDYQDCTAATARLLTALAAPDPDGHRAQIAVLGDPDVAVETFRGGTPSLLVAAEDHSGLRAIRLRLTTRYRGGPAIAAVVVDQSARVPVTGTAAHRQASLAPRTSASRGSGAPDADRVTVPTGVEAILASSAWQERAHVARALRLEHVHHGTAWSQMAVIVRSAADAESLARDLRRRGVPLASRTPAVLLRAEPAAAALLDVVRATIRDQLGGRGEPPQREAAINLLTSPLVGLTTMDLRRLRRRLRQAAVTSVSGAEPSEPGVSTEATTRTAPRTGADAALLSLLADTDQASAFARSLDGEPLGAQADRLLIAARIIEALRAAVGGVPADAPRDVEALLWAAWHASDRAEAWRAVALQPSGSSVRSLLSEAAEHDLDVVTILFKRAEVWAERHPGQDASTFLSELDAEVLPSDSVAPQGRRPEGVAVMTPARCAGQEWELVVVTGLERDRWPDLRLRDSLTRTGLLVDAVTDRLTAGVTASGDGAGGSGAVAAARAQVRADERRMLIMALSRATRRLLLTATADAEHVPSPFLTEIAQSAGIALTDADGAPLLSPDTGDLTLRGLVGELRRAAVAGNLETATTDERRRGQVAVELLADLARQDVPGADPATWIGAAGPTSTSPLVAEGERIRVSPSDVEGLAACPLKWFLSRNGGSVPASDAQALGSLIHEIAERAEKEHLRGPALKAAFEERLGGLGYPDTWLGGLASDRARAMIERLDAYLSDCDALGIRADVEQPVRADVDIPVRLLSPELRDRAGARIRAAGLDAVPVTISGRIDRLEHLGGYEQQDEDHPGGNNGVRVMDLKTGQRVPKDVQRHPQLAAYRLALASHGHHVLGGALVLLGKEPSKRSGDGYVLAPPGAALDPSPAALEPADRSGDEPSDGDVSTAAEVSEDYWAEDLVAGAAVAGSGPLLQARTGEHCRTCMVKDSCPVQVEGRRVVS